MYAIQKFVKSEMTKKRIAKSEFLKSCGYKNIPKGCRRLESFLKGESYPDMIMNNLSTALDVTEDEVKESIRKSKIEIQHELDKEKVSKIKEFEPFLFCHTTSRRPSPIFVCALLSSDRMKKVILPPGFTDLSEDERSTKRREIITAKLKHYDGMIPAFGMIVCFTEKLSLDDEENDRLVYDLNGNLMKNPPDEYKEIYGVKAGFTKGGKDITGLLKWQRYR